MPNNHAANRNAGRNYDASDEFLGRFDRALRTAFGTRPQANRPRPEPDATDDTLSAAEREESLRLMRVNHAGEVAAQALYHGQALTARTTTVRDEMREAAEEENDHLAWCEQRIEELGGQPSRLQPLWYAGSFAIGAAAGALGDRTSLGFLAETERQVVEHLKGHLDRLPENDARSRAILEQMKTDEAEHGEHARRAGGRLLPKFIQDGMKRMSRVMTETAYRL